MLPRPEGVPIATEPSIFISTTSADLSAVRDLVAKVLISLGYHPVWQDIAATEGGDLVQVLRDRIDPCQAVIQLIGQRYGFGPPQPIPGFGQVSYTQFEAMYAETLGKKVVYIVLPQGFPTTACAPEAPEKAKLQADYLARLRATGRLRHTATNIVELENRVLRFRDDLAVLRTQMRRGQRRAATIAALGFALLIAITIGIWQLHQSGRQQGAAIGRVETHLQSVQAPLPTPEEITLALASADVGRLKTFSDRGVPPQQLSASMAVKRPGLQIDVAREFFEKSRGSAEADAWFRDALKHGLDPNVLVPDDYYEQHAMLSDAIRSGNASAVLALLAGGADPHPYQNVWLTSASLPMFLFPHQYIVDSDRFSRDEKASIVRAMAAAGAAVFRADPDGKSDNDTMQLSAAAGLFKNAPQRIGMPIEETAPDTADHPSPVARAAAVRTGFDWVSYERTIPRKIEPVNISDGESCGLYWVEIRNLISVSQDKAYFAGVARCFYTEYALIEASRDARSLSVFVFVSPQAGMGLCHNDGPEKIPPKDCWRKYPMTFDPATGRAQVLGYYDYTASTPR